jgi:Pyridoxamine 5'-phosphate oxidase
MAWLRPNGAPYSTATWYIFDGDEHIVVNTNSSRRRVKDLRHDPRVTLTALAHDDVVAARFVNGVPFGVYVSTAILVAADLMPSGRRGRGVAIVTAGPR